MTDEHFSKFYGAYIACALWSSTDDDGEPLDTNYNEGDLTEGTKAALEVDCAQFVLMCAKDLEALAPEQAGHDFWLTRNRHGVGFWDRGLGDLGERLTKAAHAFGEQHLMVDHLGQVHVGP